MKKLLTLLILLTFTLAQNYETVLSDDFEDGNAYNWESETGWQVISVNNNYVFEGTGHKWAISPTQHSANQIYEGKFNLIQGSMHLNILKKGSRHFFSIQEDQIESFENDEYSETKFFQINYNEWHNFKIITLADTLKFYIDDQLLIEFVDPSSSQISGKLAFECLDDSKIYIDDIKVQREKIVYIQDAKWVKTGGPLGGIGYDVRIDPEDPDIVYVTDNWAGVHKSYDGGHSWVQKIDGIYSRTGSTNDAIPIFCLTIDPNDPNIIWTGTFGMRGIYRSEDKAETWQFSGNGIENVENITTRNFCIMPGNSDVVFLGVEWTLYEEDAEALNVPSGTAKGKIYRTKDGGKNWEEVLFCDALVRTIIIDPNNTDIIYAATGIFDRDHVAGSGIYKSTDGGDTWKQINNGIRNLTVGDIEMHPTNSNILMAATGRLSGFSREANSEDGEILRSEDGGETWTEMTVNFDDPVNGEEFTLFTYLEWDESDHNVVYAAASDRGFFKSVDGGLTFNPTAYNPPKINAGHIISVATHKDKPGQVFANSYGGGVFLSTNRTESWAAASDGYTGNEVTDMTISSTDPEKVFLVSRTASFQTNDGGTSWFGNEASRQFNGVWLGDLEERAVAVHPQNDDIILIGGSGVFRKEAGNEIFDFVYNIEDDFPDRELAVQSITFAPSNNNIVYAGIALFGGYSIDRPDTFDPTQPAEGVLKSTDGGKTWTSGFNSGLEDSKLNVMKIAVHPTDENILYLTTLNNGVYKSIDGANNWTKIGNEISGKDTRSIAIDKNNPDILYVGTQRDGIYKSTDAGVSFTKLTNGIESEGAIRDIEIDPTNSNRVYASDWLSGVYLSEDAGSTWRIINDGLSTRAVQRLVVSDDGVYVYAGTQGEGVFRMTTINKGPVLRFASPDHSKLISITSNTELEFLVSAYDFNGDEITYGWYVNDAKIDSLTSTSMTLNTELLGNGSHKVTCKISDGNNSPLEIDWNLSINIVGIEDRVPLKHQLNQNYPNPFNPETTIEYELSESSEVLIEVFNVLGEKVCELVNKELPSGKYTIKFDGSNLSSGMYILRMKAGDFIKHRKMMLMK